MADIAPDHLLPESGKHPLHSSSAGKWFVPVFLVILLCGLGYVAYALGRDLTEASAVPWILLGLALLIALGFEFVNGFHDTANAVATVIYTRSMPAELAVIWSGFFNFLGVLTSTGAVAFGILALLPVELILQVGSGSGLAMVFALLTELASSGFAEPLAAEVARRLPTGRQLRFFDIGAGTPDIPPYSPPYAR